MLRLESMGPRDGSSKTIPRPVSYTHLDVYKRQVIGLAIIIIKRKGTDYELPFGAFLGAASLLVVFFGSPVVEWYASLLRFR